MSIQPEPDEPRLEPADAPEWAQVTVEYVEVLPTQVRHPVRTLVRGLVQWGPTLAAGLPLVVNAVEEGHPGWTGAIGAGIVAVSSAITRVMAIPQVNGWLARLNLDAGSPLATGRHARLSR